VVDEVIFRTENPRNQLMPELMARGGEGFIQDVVAPRYNLSPLTKKHFMGYHFDVLRINGL
jgi:hypothetical protein